MAAYGYEGYFRVSSVMLVSGMADSTSQRRQEERQSGNQQEFRAVLEEKTKQLQENRLLEGKTIGYTKTGQLCSNTALKRSYN